MAQVDPQLWNAARLKAEQLEREIRASAASDVEKSNMLHTLSKLAMFAGDAAGTPL